MVSSNGNNFCVTGPLWVEYTGHRWIPTQSPVTRSFGVFFDLRLNKRLNKQSGRWWIEMPSRSLWRHCNEFSFRLAAEKSPQLHITGCIAPLRWRHNDHAGVLTHQPHGCLLNRLFRRKSKKTSKLRVTGLCVGNSPGTGEFPAQMASYAENVSIWWRHHPSNAGRVSWNFIDMVIYKHWKQQEISSRLWFFPKCRVISEGASKYLISRKLKQPCSTLWLGKLDKGSANECDLLSSGQYQHVFFQDKYIKFIMISWGLHICASSKNVEPCL